MDKKKLTKQIKHIYRLKRNEIISRLREFSKIWLEGTEEDIFMELAFCILTPQSKAKLCWEALLNLKKENILVDDSLDKIKKYLKCVRFHNKKAEYIISARKNFYTNSKFEVRPFLKKYNSVYERREWIVKNIKGIGYKEASHFLRNIGFYDNIAILDRHILKNLRLLGVIEEIPKTLSKTKYLHIEKKMAEFSKKIGIPLSHLDLLMWYKETGEIFK